MKTTPHALIHRGDARITEARALSDFTKQLVEATRLRIELARYAGVPPGSPTEIARSAKGKDLAVLGQAVAVLAKIREDQSATSGLTSIAGLAATTLMMVIEQRIEDAVSDDLMPNDQ